MTNTPNRREHICKKVFIEGKKKKKTRLTVERETDDENIHISHTYTAIYYLHETNKNGAHIQSNKKWLSERT